MTRLVVCGLRGRMGAALRQVVAERTDVRIVGGIGSDAGEAEGIPIVTLDGLDQLPDADAIIDFSSAATTHQLVRRLNGTRNEALLTGTTGLRQETLDLLEQLAATRPVLAASNFSIGVNLLVSLVRRTAAALPADAWDIEVAEAHHRRKVDAPSGTALTLAVAAADGRGVQLADVRRDGRTGETGRRPAGEIGLHAVRGGGVVGDHDVIFMSDRETVTLGHRALDRAVFADGAVRAAVWLHGRGAGRYGMNDVLGLGS